MSTTFAHGTTLASLRWSGPSLPLTIYPGSGLGRRGERVVLTGMRDIVELGEPFVSWPPKLAEGVRQRQPSWTPNAESKVAVLANGDVLASPFVTHWRDGAKVETLNAETFAVTAEGGLYTLGLAAGHYVVAFRAPEASDAREIGRFRAPSKKEHGVYPALLPDGSFLVAVVVRHEPGPIGLYRARANGRALETIQPLPTGRKVSAKKPPRRDIEGADWTSFLVGSPRGAWFVTTRLVATPDRPGSVSITELVGEGLEIARPPLVLPGSTNRLVAACAIGDRLALLSVRRGFVIHVTDGIVVHESEGQMAPFLAAPPAALLASPKNDALLLSYPLGLARCELVPEGDPRLAEPAFDEIPPPPRPLPPSEPPPPPRPAPPDREAWIERVRLFHFIRTISALHYGDGQPEHGFEGDAERGRFFHLDGSGNHLVVGWSEAGVVAFAFDKYQPGEEELAALIAHLPKSLKAFGRKLAAWYTPVGEVAWYSVADASAGQERFSDRLDAFVKYDGPKRLARWQESASISEAQLALAVSLVRATASGRHALTAEEVAVLVARPPDAGEDPAEAPVSEEKLARDRATLAALLATGIDPSWIVRTDAGTRSKQRREAVRRHLAAAGVDWSD